MEGFFAFLRQRVATARVFAAAGRDYALYRTLYHAGLRAEEAVALDIADLHFDRGPFGKIHVRFGKAAKGSGPRPRWVPMLDQLDLILRWYLQDVRPRLPAGAAAFPDSGGGRLHRGSVRNRAGPPAGTGRRGMADRFSPHALRRACATHNYERGVDLVAIQQMLGHWQIGTTMRYVSPSSTFIEDAYRRAVSATLAELEETTMKVTWRLRMAAAQREVWTGAQLRRLLAERAGCRCPRRACPRLLTRQPAQLKLSTLAALCTALECTPNDLLEVDTTPAQRPSAEAGTPGDAAGQAGTLDAAAVSRIEAPAGTARNHGRCTPTAAAARATGGGAGKQPSGPARDAGGRDCCGPPPGSAGAASVRCVPAGRRPRPGR